MCGSLGLVRQFSRLEAVIRNERMECGALPTTRPVGAGGGWHPHIVTDQLTLSQPWGNGGTPRFQTFLRLSATHLLQHSSTTSGAALARSWTSVPYIALLTEEGLSIPKKCSENQNATRIVGRYWYFDVLGFFW